MSSERKVYRLDELCEFINGFAFKSSDYVEQSDRTWEVLRMGYIHRGGGFKEDSTPVFVQRAYGKDLGKYLIRPNDIVIAMTDMKNNVAILGNTARIRDANRFVLNQRVGCIRVKRHDLVDPSYLYYYSNWQPHVDYLRARANSGVQVNLSTPAIRDSEIELPPLAEQVSIGNLLAGLDDRITLLRETNATLEAIAQALFKSWFIDFDPVRAKMAGRAPEGMDEATAALFPDALEETALGVVPKGWHFGTVGDIARLKKGTVNPGSQPDAMFEHFSLPAFDDGARPVVELGEAIKSNKTPVPSDAVLLSKLNPHIPRVWLPVSCGSNAVCSTEFLVFQPVGAGSKELIYCAFSSPDFILRLQQLVTGTSNSHQRIKPDQVALMSCVVPPKDIASQFELSMRPIFERVHANREQAQTLASLRDALLPRLISGQLRLPEARAKLETV